MKRGAHACQLGAVACGEQQTGLDDVGVDRLGPAHSDHFVDRPGGLQLKPLVSADPARAGGVPGPTAGQRRGEPAAVAPRGAVAGELRLEDDDAEVWLRRGEVVGRPQPCEAAADYAHVAVNVTDERLGAFPPADLLPPQRDVSVDEIHGRRSDAHTLPEDDQLRPVAVRGDDVVAGAAHVDRVLDG